MVTVFAAILLTALVLGALMILESIWVSITKWQHRRQREMATYRSAKHQYRRKRYGVEWLP